MKAKRNNLCPCGSGMKYKKCCMDKGNKEGGDLKAEYLKKYGIKLKNEIDIAGIRKAGVLAVKTLELVEPYLKPGTKTDYINQIVHDFTIKNNAVPAPLNYRGYPKSVCISINEEICHG
ncbi:MAG: SEC-C domain-containing protein, partial [Deltaproteobacteria bacterium]|nr:SEC-C domain-containing protein [Deltaproteobacteria bacterium]